MFFRKPLGSFIQILHGDAGVVYRLLLPVGDDGVHTEDIRAFAGFKSLDAQVYLPEGSESVGCRKPPAVVVSIALPHPMTSFTVRHRGRAVAKMTPELHLRLQITQNLLMVNPGIDGAFPEYLATHDEMLRRAAAHCEDLSFQPLISIVVPLFRTPIPYLHAMLSSVCAQTYANWELVLVNASPDDAELSHALEGYRDQRIRVIECPENLGIAGNTNLGIEASRGDYIAFLDHDDELDEYALAVYVHALNDDPSIDLFYCDEDNFREDLTDRYSPIFKPDFNIDLLYSHNYVEHFLMVSRRALDLVELSPHDVRGAQDYDLTLKVAEVARGIHHAPYLLYHWRAHAGSTNGGIMDGKPYAIEASIKALNRHFERTGVAATAHETDIPCVFSISYEPADEPIDVIARYRDVTGLERLLKGLAGQTCSKRLSVTALGGNPAEAQGLLLRMGLAGSALDAGNHGMAGIVDALGATTTDAVFLCTDSVTLNDPTCIERLAGCMERKDVGAVAPKLFTSDGLVQHAGYVIDATDITHVISLNQGFGAHMGGGYLGLAECCCNYSSVGSNCLMLDGTAVRALTGGLPTYRTLGMLVHHLCCALRTERDLRVTVLPEAQATVTAPISWYGTPYDETPEHALDRATFGAHWNGRLGHDVLFNPHVTLSTGYCNLAVSRNIDKETERLCALEQERNG